MAAKGQKRTQLHIAAQVGAFVAINKERLQKLTLRQAKFEVRNALKKEGYFSEGIVTTIFEANNMQFASGAKDNKSLERKDMLRYSMRANLELVNTVEMLADLLENLTETKIIDRNKLNEIRLLYKGILGGKSFAHIAYNTPNLLSTTNNDTQSAAAVNESTVAEQSIDTTQVAHA